LALIKLTNVITEFPIYGMNVIVHDRTQWVHLVIVLIAMLAVSGALLRWTQR